MLPLPCSRWSLLLRNPLGYDGNSLCERAGQVVRILGFIILLSPASRLFTRAQSESRFFALCGVGPIKKVRSSLSRLAGPGQSTVCFANHTVSFGNCPVPMGTVVASPQKAKSPFPKISSARGSQIPAGIWSNSRRDLLDAIARASPMDEVGSMPTSSIKIERGQNYRLTQSGGTTWGGTPLTAFHPLPSPTVRWTVGDERNVCISYPNNTLVLQQTSIDKINIRHKNSLFRHKRLPKQGKSSFKLFF